MAYNIGVNPWPESFWGLEEGRVEQIRQRLRRAEQYSHPVSTTTMADRILGEVALRYQLPQDVRDLLYERSEVRQHLQHLVNLIQDTPKPQEKPPKNERRLRP